MQRFCLFAKCSENRKMRQDSSDSVKIIKSFPPFRFQSSLEISKFRNSFCFMSAGASLSSGFHFASPEAGRDCRTFELLTFMKKAGVTPSRP